MWHYYQFMLFWYRPLINLPKNVGKTTKTAKNAKKTIIFHKFEHSFLPVLIIKQNKNNWAHNYMQHLFYFVQF